MERNRDLRRATVSAINGLPRRRQRITTLRDSTDQDRQMELQETVRLGDREQLQKKEREREFPKRRRIDRSAAQQRSDGGESYRENSTDSSDEDYSEEEDGTRIHQHNRTNQLSPTSSSLSNNRRGLHTLRSSPVLRAAADEMFGVPVPRRARSSSAKRLHEYCNSGSGGFGEELNRRRFSPSPATVSLIGPGDSMKKKMKSLERRTQISNPKRSVVQDDIEIEVAEALFDLMKQSQSQSQPSQKVDRDSVNTGDELKMSKAGGGKDENNDFSVQNEPSKKVNAETVLTDSIKELKNEGRVEKERFSDDPAQELVSGDGFVNKVKVGSPKESESPSCVKVNACDIQDPTVTKAHYDAIIVEAKKETKLEIDLMASPLPSSPERDGVVDRETDPGVMTRAVRKKSDGALAVAPGMPGEKVGVIHGNQQQSNLHVEKHGYDTTQQQQVRKEHKNQSPTPLLPFPIGMNGWPGVLPHSGYMPSLQAVMAISGSAKSSMIMQPPQFKFSRPRPKRCATHQYLAQSMHCHQQLIKKSLSSGSSSPATLCGTNSPNLKYMSPAQNFIPGNPLLGDFQGGQNSATASVGYGKDKSSTDASVAFNATTSSKSWLQQTSHPASASSFLHAPGFILPFGHHQATMMAPTNSSGSPQSASAVGNASLTSNYSGRLPVNFPLPNTSTAVSLNLPVFPSSEASPYMAMLNNNGCSIPMPPFKGGSPSMPFFNPSLYPSPAFNVNQNQQQLTANPHTPVQSASQNTTSSSHKQPQCLQQTSAKVSENKLHTSVIANSQSEKPVQASHLSSKSDSEISWKNGSPLAPGFVSHSVKPSNSQAQPMNFAMIPHVSIGSGASGNKQIDHPQQGSKGRVELIPQAFAFSFGSNASATPVLNFSSMAQTSAMFQMLPDMYLNGNQMTHQKSFHSSEGKPVASNGQSFNYLKSDASEISALSTVGAPKFDGSARNINFLPGSQPFQTSPAALSSGGSVTIPNFQQHQLIQVQDHHMHQMHLAGTGQFKSSSPHNIHGSFLTGMLPSNSTLFAQASAPNDTPSFHPKWENFPRSAAPEGSSQSGTSSLVKKTSQGQAHISFGNGTISATSYQAHQFVIKSESMSSLMLGPSSNSCLSRNTGSSQRNASAVGLAASTASALPPSQEAEASQGGASQKSSPACRRNVPSILNTCPSQLPELKY